MSITATATSAVDGAQWHPAWRFPNHEIRIVEWSEYLTYQEAAKRAEEILEAGFARHRGNPETENELRDSHQPKEEESPMPFNKEMMAALEEDGAKLRALTGEDHGPWREADYYPDCLPANPTSEEAMREEDKRLRDVFRDVDFSEIEKRVMSWYAPTPGLTFLARRIHEQNVKVGWWDQWLDDKMDRHRTAMMLVISELAEAMEGDRKGLMDDHLPHRKMFEVELADAVIRLLDLAGAYDMNLASTGQAATSFVPDLIGLTPPEQLFFVISAGLTYESEERQVEDMLAGVFGIAIAHGIDLFPVIQEKREYNARRADHKRENRAAAGGKAY